MTEHSEEIWRTQTEIDRLRNLVTSLDRQLSGLSGILLTITGRRAEVQQQLDDAIHDSIALNVAVLGNLTRTGGGS